MSKVNCFYLHFSWQTHILKWSEPFWWARKGLGTKGTMEVIYPFSFLCIHFIFHKVGSSMHKDVMRLIVYNFIILWLPTPETFDIPKEILSSLTISGPANHVTFSPVISMSLQNSIHCGYTRILWFWNVCTGIGNDEPRRVRTVHISAHSPLTCQNSLRNHKFNTKLLRIWRQGLERWLRG